MAEKFALVTDDAIWHHIQQALKSGKPARIAVPFVGMGASRWIRPAPGSWVLTRCDLQSARAGQVSGQDLLAWHKRGIRLFNLQALHAKVFAFGRSAFVGSSNASVTSRDRLVEAGVWTTDKAMAQAAWQFVESHCLEEVDEHFLSEMAAAYRPPTAYPLQGEPHPGTPTKRKPQAADRTQDEAKLHLLRLYAGTYSDAEERAAERAEADGQTRVDASVKAEIETFAWHGAPSHLQIGDLVLARLTDKSSGQETVMPWARVVAIRKVRGEDKHIVAAATLPSWQPMALDEFRAALAGQLENFLRAGGRSRLATASERSAILKVWQHRKSHLI